MANLYEQRNLSMTPDQWRALEAVAVETNSRSTRGPDAYQHSWRCMIARIAKGEIGLVIKNPYKLPDGLAEQSDEIEQQRLEHERLEEQRLTQAKRERTNQHSHEKQPVRKAPMKLKQLQMELEPA